jgi:hypothetical protein
MSAPHQRTVHRIVAIVLGLIAGLGPAVGRAAPLLAQQGPAPLVPATRSPFLDVLLVLVLFGAALFAVCRSSRRT